MRAPGHLLLAIARRVLATSEIDRVTEPAIADLQLEWSDSAKAPLLPRLAIRVRAYSATLHVVGLHIVTAMIGASPTPPPWIFIRHLLAPTFVMIGTTAAFRVFLVSSGSATDRPLLDVPDSILSQAVFLPFIWPVFFPRGNRASGTPTPARRSSPSRYHDVPSPGAGGFAKVTAIYWILCVGWSGWIAPFLRQQYLLGIGDSASATSPHQWMLSTLIAAASADESGSILGEIHQRLIITAAIPIVGVLSWAALRRYRRAPSTMAFAAHLARAVGLAIVGLMAASACESWLGSIAAQWFGYLVAGIGAVGILVALRARERTPREAHA